MSKDPFLKAIEELLEDQIDSINFKRISPAYAVTGKRTDQIMKTLESLPEAVETKAGPVKVHKLLAVA
jgi:hypothetical protein